MPFHTRNSYYLRISEKIVLPVHLYLDERHLNWMSDRILQHVLSDLRPSILDKLRTEADAQFSSGNVSSNKNAAVDTHRGDTYQFCYFFRRMEPHSLVIKKRTFVAVPSQKAVQPAQSSSKLKGNVLKRKGELKNKRPAVSSRKKRKISGENNDEIPVAPSANEEGDTEPSLILAGHPSSTAKNPSIEGILEPQEVIADGEDHSAEPFQDADVEMANTSTVEDEVPGDIPLSLGVVPLDLVLEEEEKPKPMLQLKYEGFDLYGQCLCIVIEPWPSIRSESKTPLPPSISSLKEPGKKIPADYSKSTGDSVRQREQTPLFLPDDSELDTSANLQPASKWNLPRFTYDEERDSLDDSEGSDVGGMMEFSQVLNAAGEFKAGAADDDDDMDGAVFFGDADEIREL